MARRTCDRIGCKKAPTHVLFFVDKPLFYFCGKHFEFAKKFLIFDMDALYSPEKSAVPMLERSGRC